MGSVPTPTNSTAQTVNSIIQGCIFDVALNALKTYAIAQVPFLGWPLIKQLFGWMLNKIGEFIYNYLATVATFTIIDSQVNAELKAHREAAIAVVTAALEAKDENAIKKAKDDFKAALGSLIHWDGSTPILR